MSHFTKLDLRNFTEVDFLLDDADRYASESKDLPAKIKMLTLTSELVKRGIRRNEFSIDKFAASTVGTVTNQVDHSKRKIIYTLAGPIVGFAAGVVVGGPVTWVAFGTAVAAAAVGYTARKLLRNTRALIYEYKYITTTDKGKSFKESHEALEGVRYFLQKRSISAIANDVKELTAAIREYNIRKNSAINSCRMALELTYWYNRVDLLHDRIKKELLLFEQFYDYIFQEINAVFNKEGNALNKENIFKQVDEIKKWLDKPHAEHHPTCSIGNIHGYCYALDRNGEAVRPKITVFSSLTADERNPNVRLWKDAMHQCINGENSIALYKPTFLKNELEKLVKRLLGSNAVSFDVSTLKTGIDKSYDYSQFENRALKSGMKSAVLIGAGTGSNVLMKMVRPVIGEAIGHVATTAAASGGLAALVTSPLTVAGDVINLRNETATLTVELNKPVTDMDIEKMMTALRTLLKDGNVFENTVNEVIKILKYFEEFKAVSGPPQNCEQAFEKAYRIMKIDKHFKILQQNMPLYELFSRIAIDLNKKVDAMKEETSREALKEKVKLWIDVNSNHMNCGHSGVCYHGNYV